MAYKKQTWEDRVVEKPMTYMMTTNEDGTVTLTPVPGTITNEGSKVNAERMNHIEQGIYDAAISGGSDVVFIGDTEPTNEQTKLWVEDDMLNSLGTEVINSLDGNETNLAPSVNAVNGAINSIIESGSNENGSYIKFADGTLICIGDTMNVLDSEIAEAQFLVTYPIAFVNYPSVTISNVYSYYRDLILSVAAPTPSNFRVNWYKQLGTAAVNSNIRVYWIAIGRWK